MITLAAIWINGKYEVEVFGLIYLLTAFLDICLFELLRQVLV